MNSSAGFHKEILICDLGHKEIYFDMAIFEWTMVYLFYCEIMISSFACGADCIR